MADSSRALPSEMLPVEMRARWAVRVLRDFRGGKPCEKRELDTAIRWLEELLGKNGARR